MSLKLFLAIEEQLEVDKLIEAEQLAKKENEVDMLYTASKLEEANVPEETPEDDLETNGEYGSYSTVDETGEDSDAEVTDESTVEESSSEEEPEAKESEEEKDLEEKEPEEDEKDEASVAAEAFKTIEFENLALEDTSFFSSVGSSIKAVLTSLANLGITYGPIIVNKVYKGVLYTMGKLADLLRNGTRTLVWHMEQRIYSLDKLKADISGLKEVITELKSKEQDEDSEDKPEGIKPQFTKERVINTLKISDSTDFISNVSKLNQFMEIIVKHISIRIDNDIAAIKHIIAYADSNTVTVPVKLLTTKLDNPAFSEGHVEGYNTPNELLTTTHYKETLPGDVIFISHLPSTEVTDLEQLRQASLMSKMFLGFYTDNFKNVDAIDYMTLDDLSKFLDALEQLCDTCKSQQSYYENILKNKQNLRYIFKNYFNNIISSKEKVTAKNSLIEYVYIKAVFVDKVYIASMLSIHAYTVRVITNGITLAKETVKEYS